MASRDEAGSREPVVGALSVNQVAIYDQVRLEILYSATSATDYDALADELDGLVQIPIDSETFTRAYQVQREPCPRRRPASPQREDR